MKRYSFILIPVLLLSLLGSCISIKMKHSLPSENFVERMDICKKIDESGELFEPLEVRNEFTSEDSHVICFVKLKDVASQIGLQWKWYSPEEKMVRDTGKVIVNQDEKFLEAVTAYDLFKITPENIFEGQWTVVILVDNKFIGRKTFQLRKKANEN